MKTASQVISQKDRDTLHSAIAAAEQGTSAEIVVVVATRSGRYDRAEDIFGLLLALTSVAIAWVLYQQFQETDWVAGHELTLGLIPILVLFAVWWMVGAALATRFPALARPFVPKVQFEAEVRRRGFEAFHLFRVGNTKGRNGVLIFVSLLEHMAWVDGDEQVESVLPPETWNAACAAITGASRRGDLTTGLAEAIGVVGTALSAKFPRQPDDRDELPNVVHLLD
jgi:putative membrane protein